MIAIVFYVLAALIAVFLIVAALQPAAFTITRSARIDAAAPVIFAQINDLHAWDSWSPWAKRDPNMHQEFSGERAGMGANYYWRGNSKVGEGRMTITDSRVSERVKLGLEFLKPFKATNQCEFVLTPEKGATLVSWSMQGNRNLIAKAMGLVMNLDKLVGRDFELGLAQLKTVSEAASPK